MKAFGEDLRFAQHTGVAVRVRTMSGEEAGVHDVHEDEDYVSLFAPEHLGDNTTRRKLDYDLIESLIVTDIQWGPSDEP